MAPIPPMPRSGPGYQPSECRALICIGQWGKGGEGQGWSSVVPSPSRGLEKGTIAGLIRGSKWDRASPEEEGLGGRSLEVIFLGETMSKRPWEAVKGSEQQRA